MYDWYLDAVCGEGQWGAVGVEKANKLVGVWPFFLKKKFGFQYVAMPVLGRQIGPYVLPEQRGNRHETGILEQLLEKLPPLVGLSQDCPYSLVNWLPFYWRGFRQTTRYSYELHLEDLDKIWRGLAPDYRNQKIPKAQERLEVYTGNNLNLFLEVHDRSFARQKLVPPVSNTLMQKLDAALNNRQSRAIFFAAERGGGPIYSVAYLAWDRRRAYFLMAGDHPEYRTSGSGVLIAWECIRYAAEVLRLPVFDFAGSMIKPIERVRRQFGADQVTYFRLEKEWSWAWGLMRKIRSSGRWSFSQK